jgi:hypothetical protein
MVRSTDLPADDIACGLEGRTVALACFKAMSRQRRRSFSCFKAGATTAVRAGGAGPRVRRSRARQDHAGRGEPACGWKIAEMADQDLHERGVGAKQRGNSRRTRDAEVVAER